MQTPRERLLKVLNGETPERLPWFGDLSYWHYFMSIRGKLDKKYIGAEGLLKLHKDLGPGFYYPGYYPYTPIYKNCEITEVEKNIGISSSFYKGTAYSDTIYQGYKKGIRKIKDTANNDHIREVVTPLGSIKERWLYAESSLSWAPSEYFIKSASDLIILDYWLKNTSFEPEYEQLSVMKDLIGDWGCIVCNLNKSPLMDLIHWYAGIVTAINIMVDNRKEFIDIIKILEIKAEETTKIALGSPADFMLVPDNLHSDLVGKNLFEEFLRPYYMKYSNNAKKAGKYSSIHMDGGLKGLLKEISKINFSVIEAMTPKPAGDLSLDEIDDYVTSDSVIWGGIPGVLFTPSCSDEDFEEFVIKVIRKMTTRPGYVLGIADQIPPDGIIERVKKVTELVEKYGIYKNN